MKEVNVTYDGKVKTTVTNGSPIVLKTDNSPESNANGTTMTPVDMLVGAVGACMLSMIGFTAATKGLNVDGTTVSLAYAQDDTTHAVTEINAVFRFKGQALGEERKMLEAAAKACAVGASINPAIKKNLTFEF